MLTHDSTDPIRNDDPTFGFSVPTTLPDDPTALQQMMLAAPAEIERERPIIAALQRNRFGRRSERLDDAAVQQRVEDLEQSAAEQTAALDAAMSRAPPPKTGTPPRPPCTEPAECNRGALTAEPTRFQQAIDVPAQSRVRVIPRPRYACRACEQAVVAPAPEPPIDGGMAAEALPTHVLVNKPSPDYSSRRVAFRPVLPQHKNVPTGQRENVPF